MAIIYLVRKKIFSKAGEKITQWFAVQRKIQKKGGVTNRELARRLAEYTSFKEGEVQGILIELVKVIENALKDGHSVTIDGLGTFQTAITSNGFDHPEQVTPREVRLSRIYFRADKKLVEYVEKMKFIRYPLSKYFPASMLSKKVLKEDAEEDLGEE